MEISRWILGGAVILASLVGAGCADLKDDLPPASPSLQVHPTGWSEPTSQNFHGDAIRNAGWDMRGCKTCHGVTYSGGTSDVSCRKCHTGDAGPENCITCHGSVNPAPPLDLNGGSARTSPSVGAHQPHLTGVRYTNGIRCSECHQVPPTVYTPGHLDAVGTGKVQFNGPIAKFVTNEPTTMTYSPELPLFTPSPTYMAVAGDPSKFGCANTYCHGDFKNGNNYTPVWNSTSTTEAACGTCHGDVTKPTLAERALPKTVSNGGTHPDEKECYLCHDGVVDANLNIIDRSRHMDGRINLSGEDIDF
jgi:predicted CxxxxCH...CXXCH cytochrome family protein